MNLNDPKTGKQPKPKDKVLFNNKKSDEEEYVGRVIVINSIPESMKIYSLK